jgi:NADH-quinone oxidoreductase subunit L
MFDLIPLIILFPALGILANLIAGRGLREPAAGILASAAAALSFGVALLQWVALLGHPEGTVVTLATWLDVGSLNVPFAFQVDTLSVTMMLVVTGVGALIHIYAIGYMRGDEGFTRFFIYLNLFLVAMLLLVTANNYLLMFVGWEGVGLCSYLLIGFWFDRGKGGTANATAARKAFIVNRVGDFGLILAMTLIFWHLGTLTFDGVFTAAQASLTAGAPIATAITLLLLLGAAGKSAQIPLFVWLPDAMVGPTPVSALIHAATMVTAGIYLIARSHVLFALAPTTQLIVALVGGTTALLAATIAIAQYDIKRVLAYSTISQLGFMVAAVGLGAYGAAIFHLVTHAFFKALLFLSAGSVIHALEHGRAAGSGEMDLQDMRHMGGLRAQMPLTFAAYLIGALSLVGLPPMAGFFSKDEILAEALGHNLTVYILLTIAAFCTALYMGRQILLVFGGEPRSTAAARAHESRPIMTVPLLALAVLAVIGGGLNLPGIHSLGHWLEHTLGRGEAVEFNLFVAIFSTLLALAAVGIAYALYGRQPVRENDPDPLARGLGPLFVLFNRRWWIDEGYQRVFVQGYRRLSVLVKWADRITFDGLEGGLNRLTALAASGLQVTQTGQLNWNMAGIVGGLIVVLVLLMVGS